MGPSPKCLCLWTVKWLLCLKTFKYTEQQELFQLQDLNRLGVLLGEGVGEGTEFLPATVFLVGNTSTQIRPIFCIHAAKHKYTFSYRLYLLNRLGTVKTTIDHLGNAYRPSTVYSLNEKRKWLHIPCILSLVTPLIATKSPSAVQRSFFFYAQALYTQAECRETFASSKRALIGVFWQGAVPLSEHNSSAEEIAGLTLHGQYIGSDQSCQFFVACQYRSCQYKLQCVPSFKEEAGKPRKDYSSPFLFLQLLFLYQGLLNVN